MYPRACNNRVNLYIQIEGHELPFLLGLAYSSMASVAKYQATLINLRFKPFSCPTVTALTKFELLKAHSKTGGKEHSVLQLSLIEQIDTFPLLAYLSDKKRFIDIKINGGPKFIDDAKHLPSLKDAEDRSLVSAGRIDGTNETDDGESLSIEMDNINGTDNIEPWSIEMDNTDKTDDGESLSIEMDDTDGTENLPF